MSPSAGIRAAVPSSSTPAWPAHFDSDADRGECSSAPLVRVPSDSQLCRVEERVARRLQRDQLVQAPCGGRPSNEERDLCVDVGTQVAAHDRLHPRAPFRAELELVRDPPVAELLDQVRPTASVQPAARAAHLDAVAPQLRALALATLALGPDLRVRALTLKLGAQRDDRPSCSRCASGLGARRRG